MLTWLVTGQRADAAGQAERGIEGLTTACIGRDAELALLHAAQAAGALRGVAILAEPGVGKTRLAREFLHRLAQRPGGVMALSAQAGARGAAQPYGLLRQWLVQTAGLRDSDGPGPARQRWLAAQAPRLRSQGDAAVLGHLIGLDFSEHPALQSLGGDAQQLRDRGFFHALQLLQALATEGGQGMRVVLLLDDLHAADDGSLAFVDHLFQHKPDLPALVLALARPELAERTPALQRHAAWQTLPLAPLSADGAAALGRQLLARLPDGGGALLPQLVAASGGNPYYLEELVQMLRDRGSIVADGPQWRLADDRLTTLPLPRTLIGVLQSRLDRLPADAARLLQAAAIVGPVFWDDALTALGLDTTPLDLLVERQLVTAHARSRLEGRREYSFRHDLMYRVCYDRVVQAERVAGHVRVARWLERLPAGAPPEQLAHHHERGEEPALALAAWKRAAQQAQAQYANAEALSHAGRALALAGPADTGLRFTLLRLRAQVLALTGDTAGWEAELDAWQALTDALDDDLRRAEVLDARAKFLYETGDAHGALAAAEKAARLAPPTALQLRTSAGRHAVHALQRLGRHDEAATRAGEVLVLARRAGEPAMQGAMLNLLGLMADEQGDPDRAIGHYEEALQCHRATGHQGHEADVLSNLGYVQLGLGAYEDAAERFEEVLTRVRRIGQREREAAALLNLALVALHTGRAGEALKMASAAEAVLGALRSRWLAAGALRIAGQACLAAGLADEARQRLQQAVQAFEALDARSAVLEARASLARAHLAAGDVIRAREEVDTVWAALAVGDPLLGAEEPLRVWADALQVLQALGDARATLCQAQGQGLLQARAGRIRDERLRHSFLMRVPHHRVLDAVG